MRLEREIDEAIELITTFPEAAARYAEVNRDDFRSIPVQGYRLIYMILENRILIVSFKPGRSSSALD
jgi:mRNA-degrading endonuclease RelE of RelBE toxin-antitoxin system